VVYSHLLCAEPIALRDSLVQPANIEVFVILRRVHRPLPQLRAFLLVQRQCSEGMVHLVDCLGLCDGWVASAQVEDLIVPPIMLFLVRLVDEDKRFQCLHCF